MPSCEMLLFKHKHKLLMGWPGLLGVFDRWLRLCVLEWLIECFLCLPAAVA